MDQNKHPDNRRRGCLRTAETLVCGDRNAAYGPPDGDFRRTATMWEAYLEGIEEQRGALTLLPHDVAAMMALLKVSRIAWSPERPDSWDDLAGYAACGAECAEIEAERNEIG